jgi:hypothetical protein
MKLAASGDVAISQTEQGNLKGTLQGVLRQLGDRRRGGGRKCPLQEPDRLAGERREPPGKARTFEPLHRRGKSFAI